MKRVQDDVACDNMWYCTAPQSGGLLQAPVTTLHVPPLQVMVAPGVSYPPLHTAVQDDPVGVSKQLSGNLPLTSGGNGVVHAWPTTHLPMTLDTSQPALVHMTLGLPVCPGGQPPVQRLPVRVLMQFAQVAVLPGTIGASAHTFEHEPSTAPHTPCVHVMVAPGP